MIFHLSLAVASASFAGSKEVALPMTHSEWLQVSFRGIPPNKLSFEESKMIVSVDSSASPIVHRLKTPVKVEKISGKGFVQGSKGAEGTDFDEDSPLRFGLVAVGTKTLNRFQRALAADWVLKLFELAPKDSGLDRIHFFNLTNRPALIGKERTHPKSDLLQETVISGLNSDGSFSVDYKLPKPIETAAIWLSIDGDDTKSKYSLQITNLSIFRLIE